MMITRRRLLRDVTSVLAMLGSEKSRAAGILILASGFTIIGTPVLSAVLNQPYAGFTVSVTGGAAPITYSLHAGSWPTGITLNSSTGVVSGTPTASGTFAGIVIRATDNNGATADLPSFTLTVNTPTWKTIAIGGGGFVTGIDIAADGTRVCRCDSYGAYRWNGSKWVPLLTTVTLPASLQGFDSNHNVIGNGMGAYEIVQAPGDSTTIYAEVKGRTIVSSNSGATFTDTPTPLVVTANTVPSNDATGTRLTGRKAAVDPQNKLFLIIALGVNGIYLTQDGGTTWTELSTLGSGVPKPLTARGGVVAFDPSSSVSGGFKQGIYVGSDGNGIYHSTDGGATWTLINQTGMPTTFRHMVCDASGNVWVTDNTHTGSGQNNLNLYTPGSPGTWTAKAIGTYTNQGQSIIVSGSNVYVGQVNGSITRSSNGGSTWTNSGGNTNTNRHAGVNDPPWMAWTNELSMSMGDIMLDSNTGRCYFAEGIGVWYTDDLTTSPIQWTSQTIGIEGLPGTHLLNPNGGGGLIGTFFDRPQFWLGNPTVYPSTHGVAQPTLSSIIQGYESDYVRSSPNTVITLGGGGSLERAGISTVSGKVAADGSGYTKFAKPIAQTLIPGTGKSPANVATLDGTIIVAIVGNNAPMGYSLDGGANWTLSTVGSVPTSGNTGWNTTQNGLRHALCQDGTTIFAVNNGTGNTHTYEGIYSSTDGVNWTYVQQGWFTSAGIDGFAAIMRAVPGKTGHMFYTAGQVSGAGLTGNFYRTMDGWATRVALPNVIEVFAFGFGAPQSGGGYPALYIAGYVDQGSGLTWGIYRSDNADQATPTWTALQGSDHVLGFPTDSCDQITAVEGDMSIFGRVSVLFAGSGGAYFG